MKKNITFVGLDVHKDSIDVALADFGRDGIVRFYGTIGGDLDSLHKVNQGCYYLHNRKFGYSGPPVDGSTMFQDFRRWYSN